MEVTFVKGTRCIQGDVTHLDTWSFKEISTNFWERAESSLSQKTMSLSRRSLYTPTRNADSDALFF